MPTFRTQTEVVNSALRLAQMEQLGTGPDLVVPADLQERADESTASLWDMMKDGGAEALLELETTITPQVVFGGETMLLLPTDFYKITGLEHYNGTRWCPVERLRKNEEPHKDRYVSGERVYRLSNIISMRRADEGPRLFVWPEPAVGEQFRLRYIPEAPALGDDIPTDETPGTALSLPNRWWQWIQYDLAVNLVMREEGDHRALEKRRDEIGLAIMRSSAQSDHYRHGKIQDRRAYRSGRRARWPE